MSPKRRQPAARFSRVDWVKAAWDVLHQSGPGEIPIAEIAERLGVTRGSFYWHFEDRDEFRRAMLQHNSETQTNLVIRAMREVSGGPKHFIRKLVLFLARECDLDRELVVHDWARQDPKVAKAVAEEQARRIAFLSDALRTRGMSPQKARFRAETVVLMLMGVHLTRFREQSEHLERYANDIARLFGE